MTDKEKLDELYAWMQQRKQQQISEAAVFIRNGATALTQVYTDSHGDTVTAPKAYLGSIVLQANGRFYELPYIT